MKGKRVAGEGGRGTITKGREVVAQQPPPANRHKKRRRKAASATAEQLPSVSPPNGTGYTQQDDSGLHQKRTASLQAPARKAGASSLSAGKPGAVEQIAGRNGRKRTRGHQASVVGGAPAQPRGGQSSPGAQGGRGAKRRKTKQHSEAAPAQPPEGGTNPTGKPLSSNWLQLRTALKLPAAQGGGHKAKAATPPAGHGDSGASSAQPSSRSEPLAGPEGKTPEPLSSNQSVTKVLGLDCEMVGVGLGGKRSMLAHVCLVNSHGNVIYEKHVRPMEAVTDYRTRVSGVRPRNLKGAGAENFWAVQKEVAALLKGRILVGHALHNDLKALLLSHPKKDTRDTAKFQMPGRSSGRTPALRVLAADVLGLSIQQGQHSPVDDARAAVYLYLKYKKEWEGSLAAHTKQVGRQRRQPRGASWPQEPDPSG